MLVLNILIGCGAIKVPLLFNGLGPLFLQVFTTSMSILTTIISLSFESKGLEENLVEFIMTSVKAKQDWVPYGD